MTRDLFIENRLFCPGPTPVPLATRIAGLDTSLYHRTNAFFDLFRSCSEMLRPIFGTTQLPLILTASGTGGMEAAVSNLTSVGDSVVVVNGGKFGERWEKMTQAFRCETRVIRVESGEAVTNDQILSEFKSKPAPRAFFIQANETSTGVRMPVHEIVPIVRRLAPECLIVVDAISSLCAHPMDMDALGIDCVVAGSQKGFGMAPGLTFIALSERAWKNLSKRERFYFDLGIERKEQSKGSTAWTPAISLVQGLYASLVILNQFGIEKVTKHHATLGNAARCAVQSLGLSLFARANFSEALTAIKVPNGVDGLKLIDRLEQQYGAVFAGGQDELKGKIVRLSHLGFMSRFDLLDGLAAFEFALRDEGFEFDLGKGVAAAMGAFG